MMNALRPLMNPVPVLALLMMTLMHLQPVCSQVLPSDVRKKALLNGFEIFFLPPGESSTVHFGLMIKNGAAFDPVDKWGATNLMAQMLFRGGTTRRNAALLDRDLAEMGAQIECRVEWDAIFFTGRVPAARVSDVLALLAERMVYPDLSAELFEQERNRVVTLLNGVDNRSRATQGILAREVFRGNPYGHPVEGTLETLQKIDVTDIKIQYRRLLLPNQAQLALSYNDADNRLFLAMGRPWGGWVRSEGAPFTFRKAQPVAGRRVILVDTPGTETILRFGTLGTAVGSREFYPLKVLEHYLTLSLTDWARTVENSSQIKGSARFTAMRMPGLLQLNLQVPNQELGAYIQQVEQSLARVREDEIAPDRYKEAKELAFIQFKEPFELPQGRVTEILRANLYGVGISHIVNYGLRLDRVHPKHVGSVTREFFTPQSLVLVAAGPAREIEAALRAFGPVEILK